MDSDSNSEDSALIIVTRADRLKIFCKIYWKTLVLLLTPLVLIPITYVGENNAYTCFYIFLLTVIYWITDVMPPCITALVPLALSSILGTMDKSCLNEVYLSNTLTDCLGVMMIIIAIEYSQINRRIAVKLLLIFGYSHYRLSFLLFFGSMLLSTFISNTAACGLMMPLVKAVLTELEKLGLLEIYETIGKARQKSNRHEQNVPRPTKFTIFYFLGIAYSASIGGMATVIGSETNQLFKFYCDTIFPSGRNIEFPHFMLLNLPGVLITGTLVYLWMNFYFLGMFRVQNEVGIHVGMSEEETQYVDTLLNTQYQQMGKPKFHEIAVSAIVILSILMQVITSAYVCIENQSYSEFRSYISLSAPSIVCAVLLFIIPKKLEFLEFLKRRPVFSAFLPKSPSKACLNWAITRNNIHWSVLFIIGGGSTIFEALKQSKMTDEFEKFLLLFEKWPTPALAIVVIVFCKICTEFATNISVARCLLPHIAKLSVISRVHPHYLMAAADLACSLPFHFVTGSPVNAMVCAYVHIPPWKLMHAGVGPTIISVVVIWFTMTVWSKVVWTDINLYPTWADDNIFNKKG